MKRNVIYKNRYFPLMVIIVIVAACSCDNAVAPNEIIRNPNPENGATGVPCDVILRWDQPTDCKMTEIYFAIEGTNWQPVELEQPGYYDPGILNGYTEYRWKIVTYGEDMEGPEWTFTTGEGNEDDEHLLWRFKTGDRIHSDPVVAGDMVYFGSNDNVIYCLSAETGALEWVFPTDYSNYGGFAYDTGRVFSAAGFNDIGCFRAITGEPIWYKEYTGNFNGFTPFYYESTLYIGTKKQYIGSDSYCFCLNADDGQPVWYYYLPDTVSSDAYVADGKVFFGCSNDTLLCVDAKTGEEIWVLKGYRILKRPFAINGKVFVNADYYVYCLDADTGQIIWNTQLADLVWGEILYAEGNLYIGCEDHNMYCLNADDGSIIWTALSEGAIRSGCALYDGKLYFGSDDYHLYCVNATDGSVSWKYETGAEINCRPYCEGGRIFFGSADTYFYCVDVEE